MTEGQNASKSCSSTFIEKVRKGNHFSLQYDGYLLEFKVAATIDLRNDVTTGPTLLTLPFLMNWKRNICLSQPSCPLQIHPMFPKQIVTFWSHSVLNITNDLQDAKIHAEPIIIILNGLDIRQT